jgi:hypothetical protein
MHPVRLQTIGIWVGLGLLSAWGCRDQPPPPQYPENLGDGETSLLPTPSREYPKDILEGQANVVAVGETLEKPPAPAPAGVPPEAEQEPTSKWGQIFSRALSGGPPTLPPEPDRRGRE